MSKQHVLLAGLMGGCAPSLAVVAGELASGAAGSSASGLGFQAGVLLNGLLGLLVVFVYRETCNEVQDDQRCRRLRVG